MNPTRPLLALTLALALGPGAAGQEGDRLVVLSSLAPLGSLATAVAGPPGSGRIEIEDLAPPGVGPADYDLAADPAARRRIEAATAILTLRQLRLAPRFDEIYPIARGWNIRIVEIDPSRTWDPRRPRLPLAPALVDSLRTGAQPDRVESATANPHLWLSTSHAAGIVRHLADDFAALDPAHADGYRSRSQATVGRLIAMRRRHADRFATLDRPAVAALSEAFPYLTADMGIEVVDYVLEAADAAEVEERVRASGVCVVLAERDPPADVAAAIERAGGRTVVLDTLERGSAADDFLIMMEQNLETLYLALKDTD